MESPPEKRESDESRDIIYPEIGELDQAISRIGSRLEQEGSPEAERQQAIKDEIRNHLEKIKQTPDFAAPISTRDETRELTSLPSSQQVGALISLALEQGLSRATEVARSLNSPAILDEFRDTLVDHYYDDLRKKGII